MKFKGFIKDCFFFQSKEPLHKFLGVFVWIQILNLLLKAFNVY